MTLAKLAFINRDQREPPGRGATRSMTPMRSFFIVTYL